MDMDKCKVFFTYIKWYIRLLVISIIFILLYISALWTRTLMNFLIWFDAVSKSENMTNDKSGKIINNKWHEFDRFVENPDNHFIIQMLLNIRVDKIDMQDPQKRQAIVNMLYLNYCKINHLRLI